MSFRFFQGEESDVKNAQDIADNVDDQRALGGMRARVRDPV